MQSWEGSKCGEKYMMFIIPFFVLYHRKNLEHKNFTTFAKILYFRLFTEMLIETCW